MKLTDSQKTPDGLLILKFPLLISPLALPLATLHPLFKTDILKPSWPDCSRELPVNHH